MFSVHNNTSQTMKRQNTINHAQTKTWSGSVCGIWNRTFEDKDGTKKVKVMKIHVWRVGCSLWRAYAYPGAKKSFYGYLRWTFNCTFFFFFFKLVVLENLDSNPDSVTCPDRINDIRKIRRCDREPGTVSMHIVGIFSGPVHMFYDIDEK